MCSHSSSVWNVNSLFFLSLSYHPEIVELNKIKRGLLFSLFFSCTNLMDSLRHGAAHTTTFYKRKRGKMASCRVWKKERKKKRISKKKKKKVDGMDERFIFFFSFSGCSRRVQGGGRYTKGETKHPPSPAGWMIQDASSFTDWSDKKKTLIAKAIIFFLRGGGIEWQERIAKKKKGASPKERKELFESPPYTHIRLPFELIGR